MARLSKEFVKLETRLLNDHRFFTMNEFEQLVYIKLLGISRSTGNKIPKKMGVVGELLRTKRDTTEVKSAINRIKSNFPKFKENKYFYYFEDYELRLNNSAPKKTGMGCVDEDEDKDVDKDEDEDKDLNNKASPALRAVLNKVFKDGFNIYSLINRVKKELKWGAGQMFPEEVLMRVCEAYEQDKGKITEPWPWFVKVLKLESANWNANRNMAEGQGHKQANMALSVKQILGMR